MGKTKIRRLFSQESKWTDKSCKKHKHDFTIQTGILLTGDKNKHIGDTYYVVTKCSYCNSFINASFVENPPELPILVFEKPHFAIGFKDIEYKGSK